MGLLKLFIQGFSTANRRARLVIYLWLMNFVFSLIIITPVYILITKEFSRTLLGDIMAEGFGLLWFADLAYKYKDIPGALAGWVLAPGIIFLFLYVFLNGGLIGRIADEREIINFEKFFSDCGKYFFRFFRVFIISLFGYALVVIIHRLVGSLFKIWTDNASSEWPLIISSNLKFLILLLLFSIVRMYFDYVKIRLVVEDSKRTVLTSILNLAFIGRRFIKAWLLYLLVGIVGLLIGLIYLGISRIMPSAGYLVIAVFIWQQIYIFSRMWVKLLFFSTEYQFLVYHKTSLP
ncbi:MAG: hypothetical protein GTO17_07265 [Candidatus Aminicenantes bacterium]|nr:hypothetical protein [Candidatus Aminicenantes bacterium]